MYRIEYDEQHDTAFLYIEEEGKQTEVKSYVNEENVHKITDKINKIIKIVQNDKKIPFELKEKILRVIRND